METRSFAASQRRWSILQLQKGTRLGHLEDLLVRREEASPKLDLFPNCSFTGSTNCHECKPSPMCSSYGEAILKQLLLTL